MVGAEYTVIKKGTNIITLIFFYFVWDGYENVKALCFYSFIKWQLIRTGFSAI